MRHQISIIIAGVSDTAGNVITWHAANGSWTSSQRYGTLIDVGAFAAQVEEGQSIAQSHVTSFSIIADDLHSPIGNRAIDIFSVIGAEQLTAADVWSTVGCTAGDGTITLAAGTAQTLAVPFLHIGTECVQTSSTSIPASGLVTVTRGAQQTMARPHRATGAGYLARTIPVTKKPVDWIGRRVLVMVDGQIWRIGFLSENPIIQGNRIAFSYVSNENLVSVERSGDYVPTYGTTLAPATNYLYQNIGGYRQWHLFYSAPGVRWSAAAGHRNGISHDDVLNADAAWELTVGGDADRFIQLSYFQESDEQGRWQNPRVQIVLSNWSANGHQYLLDVENASYLAYAQGDCAEWNFSFRQTDDLLAFQQDTLATGAWYCDALIVGPVTTPCYPTSPVVGEESSSYGNDDFFGQIDMWSKFDYKITSSDLICQFNASEQVGYLLKFNQPHYCGIVSRRNKLPDEDIRSNSAGNLFAGLAPLSSWDVYTSPNTPCDPDRASPNDCFYPIRPRADGAIHNVIVKNGCVLSCDMWPVTTANRSISIGIDIASAWWEIGMAQIFTVAIVPGVSGSDFVPVSISWSEPDGTAMQAEANLRRRSDMDQSSYYCYDISNVRFPGGKPCIGFGSWSPNVVTITRPVAASVRLGNIVPQMIASADGTTTRAFDWLGDGLGCPLTTQGATSLSALQSGALPNLWWHFSPSITKYSDFLQVATVISGQMIVGAVHPDDPAGVFYGPETRPAGRPTASEAVDSWTDADIIGLPQSSGDGGLVYTAYTVTCGGTTVSIPDWLAADILGQGEELELDLTDIYSQPKYLTADTVGSLVDSMRDRFGTMRRRWSLRVSIDRGLQRVVGDVVSITSQHLIAATGEIGVTNALARIMSISHDFTAGTCDVQLLAWASYGAGQNIAWDAFISAYSSPNYTLSFGWQTGLALLRAKLDQQQFAPDGTTSAASFRMLIYKGPNAGRYVTGYFSSWNVTENGGTAVFVQTTGAGPTMSNIGGRVIVTTYTSRAAYADLFQAGRDRLM